MKKILYITGSRADYGLMRMALAEIRKIFKLEIVVCGMHLMPEFGSTIKEIKRDGFKIKVIKAVYESDAPEASGNFIGDFIKKLTASIINNRPDMILVLGDRAEMLAAAIAGVYLMIPVAHIHGGDISSTVDEISRHAITKLSHIHLAATKKSAERIIKMGEQPWRVHIVGAPGLDSILNEDLLTKREIQDFYRIDLRVPLLLVIQHPVSLEAGNSGKQMKQTMEAVKELGCQSIVIYPNADAGGRKMAQIINQYKKYPFIRIYRNIARRDYLSLLNTASVMIGNSSSGIIESALFHLPVVNVGTRQKGRERARNIIDADYNKEQIIKAVKKCLGDKKFRQRVNRCQSPYGDGKAGVRIAKILGNIVINKKLLQKTMGD